MGSTHRRGRNRDPAIRSGMFTSLRIPPSAQVDAGRMARHRVQVAAYASEVLMVLDNRPQWFTDLHDHAPRQT